MLQGTSINEGAFSQCFNLFSVSIGPNVTMIGDNAFNYCDNLINMTIPNSVTSIGYDTFIDCTSLTNITIGTNVTSIGQGAFVACTSLTSVMIPNSVTNLGIQAFSSCSSLTNITFGSGVTSIGIGALNCSSLMTITVDTNNPVYSSLAGVLFNKNQTTLVQFPCAMAQSYTFPASVTAIGTAAFGNCRTLTNVVIDSSVISFGYYAFQNCIDLTSITIPASVTSISPGPFIGCSSLTTITVDTNNQAYSSMDGVLFNKNKTTLVQYPEGKAVSYPVPQSVTTVGSYAFAYFPGLMAVYFQGKAPSTDSSVFYNDNNVTVYYLPGTTGWGTTYDNRPTKQWNPRAQTSGASFGVRTNRFGFNITGSSNLVIVVEACTNFTNPIWLPVSTNTLNTFIGTNGTSYFSDPKWTNYPGRFYRLRSP